jgi:transcriptional regulator with XRE-family HTH domain
MSTEFNGTALRVWRKRKGLRREDVAAACHVSAAAVHNWESGRSNPHSAVLPILEKLISGQIAVIPLTAVEERLLDESVQRGEFDSREEFLATALTEVIRGTLAGQPAHPLKSLPNLKVADGDLTSYNAPKKEKGA